MTLLTLNLASLVRVYLTLWIQQPYISVLERNNGVTRRLGLIYVFTDTIQAKIGLTVVAEFFSSLFTQVTGYDILGPSQDETPPFREN